MDTNELKAKIAKAESYLIKIQQDKMIAIKSQRYEEACALRDLEIELLRKLEYMRDKLIQATDDSLGNAEKSID